MFTIFRYLNRYLHSTAPGGLSMYWAVMIGVILMSGYLVGGLIPKRFSPQATGQAVSFKPPQSSGSLAALQMRSLSFQGCRGLPAVLFLIDTSTAMTKPATGTTARRIDLVKSALLLFGTKLTDEGLLGIMTYSDSGHNDPSLKLPVQQLGGNRDAFSAAVGRLDATGLSYLRKGMEAAQNTLRIAQNENPTYQFNLIIISDSIPTTAICEADPNGPTCSCKGDLCLAKDEDPTQNPDIAKAIRDKGVKIYTIGITNPDEAAFKTEFEKMLQNIASNPQSRYYTIMPTAATISQQLGTIGDSLCLNDEDAAKKLNQ